MDSVLRYVNENLRFGVLALVPYPVLKAENFTTTTQPMTVDPLTVPKYRENKKKKTLELFYDTKYRV